MTYPTERQSRVDILGLAEHLLPKVAGTSYLEIIAYQQIQIVNKNELGSQKAANWGR